jgi:hypothetical protein
MKKRAVAIATACLKRSRFMEILAFMRIPAKWNAYSGWESAAFREPEVILAR